MNNEVRKETNLEHYKEELKEIFIDGEFPSAIAYKIANRLDENITFGAQTRYIEDILDWMAQPYKGPILDDVEKSYLRSVIKPFRSRVKYIYKASCDDENCFIRIVVSSDVMRYGSDFISLPIFRESTMYKGMVLDANNFKVRRKVVALNTRTNEPLFTVEGYISIKTDDDGDLNVTIRTGEDEYKLFYAHLSDDVTYTSIQLEPRKTNQYAYEISFFPVKEVIMNGFTERNSTEGE